jgi:hypothetical protein
MTNDEIREWAAALAKRQPAELIELRLRELAAGVYGASKPTDNSRRILVAALEIKKAEVQSCP